MRQISDNIKFLVASGATVAGQTAITGSTIDTQGCQDLAVLATLGTIVATGTVALKLMQGDAADGSDKVDIPGATASATEADDNKQLIVEVHRPTKRYITPVITRATANSDIVAVHALLSGSSHTPVDQPQVAATKSVIGT